MINTLTISQELAEVDRELLVIANVCVMRSHDLLVEQLKTTDHKDEYRAEISRLKNAHAQLIAILAAPAVERQEPVALIAEAPDCIKPEFRPAWIDGWNSSRTAQMNISPPAPVAMTDSFVQPVPDKCDRITWRGRYYHLPPAQVAVVLPEYMEVPDFISETQTAQDNRQEIGEALGHNACLDKVKEMNR